MDRCSVLRGSLNGRRVWGRMNTDICMAESLCCLPEIYITLLVGYTPIKIKLKKKKVKVAQSCPTLCDPMDCIVHGILQARILEWVAFLFSRGSSPTRRLNPGLLHHLQIVYQLSYKRSLRILEWVAYPFSSRSSQPKGKTRVSCVAGAFFTTWAMKEALKNKK